MRHLEQSVGETKEPGEAWSGLVEQVNVQQLSNLTDYFQAAVSQGEGVLRKEI